MNPTVVVHTMIQRALSPARMLVVVAVVVFPAVLLSFMPQVGVQMLKSGLVLGLVLGAGLIGQDISSGVLQLLFARPVSRASYVLSRWFAVGAFATGAVLIQIALGTSVMAMRGVPESLGTIGGLALEQTLAAFGVVSVLTLFSSLLPGAGDLMSWILMNIVGGVLQMIGGLTRSPWLMRASTEWSGFLSPTFQIGAAVGPGGVVSWFHIVSYLSTVTLCLTLAIVILNRRELSYATD